MRSFWRGWMALALLAACGAVIGAACENTAGQCELTAECTGAPGVVPGACDPNIADGPIPETCGTFASASADAAAGNGSPSQPYSTLEQAIDAAKQTSARVVYACAETFTENVVLPADFILYGGLDCKNGWALAPEARTTVAPAADIPLTFEAGETIHVENVLALAPDGAPADAASEATLSGGSSIAALALSGSKVDLLRCDLVAGNGAPGATIAAAPQGPAAPNGERGEDACVSGGTGLGGTGGDQTCDAMTSGGDGGMAGESGAPDGQSGVSGSPPGVGGAPGTGQTASNDCTPGVPGTKGGTGDPGEGGELSPGLLDTATWKGNPGTSGKAGRDGSGGGGGGGGKVCMGGLPGAGGGGGGAGACGGAGGKGGGAGGSSIALWAVDAAVSLGQSTLTAHDGGAGATGGAGQKGAPGGTGGAAGVASDGSAACGGGDGGDGGDGGPGGGGQGGSSIAVVWNQAAPAVTQASTLTPGPAGDGGPAGEGGPAESNGAGGLSCPGFDIATGECVSL